MNKLIKTITAATIMSVSIFSAESISFKPLELFANITKILAISEKESTIANSFDKEVVIEKMNVIDLPYIVGDCAFDAIQISRTDVLEKIEEILKSGTDEEKQELNRRMEGVFETVRDENGNIKEIKYAQELQDKFSVELNKMSTVLNEGTKEQKDKLTTIFKIAISLAFQGKISGEQLSSLLTEFSELVATVDRNAIAATRYRYVMQYICQNVWVDQFVYALLSYISDTPISVNQCIGKEYLKHIYLAGYKKSLEECSIDKAFYDNLVKCLDDIKDVVEFYHYGAATESGNKKKPVWIYQIHNHFQLMVPESYIVDDFGYIDEEGNFSEEYRHLEPLYDMLIEYWSVDEDKQEEQIEGINTEEVNINEQNIESTK